MVIIEIINEELSITFPCQPGKQSLSGDWEPKNSYSQDFLTFRPRKAIQRVGRYHNRNIRRELITAFQVLFG
jgi:hypothetical protein